MRQLLAPRAFTDPLVATHEDTHVFGRSWQLVGLQSDLPRPGDYTLVRVAGKQWLLRRGGDGVVRAFANVCLHRGSRICTARGNGPMRCGYHGWTYDDHGKLSGVPFRGDFERQELDALHLREARVEAWGPALFLNPQPSGLSLQRELGALHAQLDPLFLAMGEPLDYGVLEIDANWKIVMENALETYHVRFIHGESIQPLGFEVTRTEYERAHSVSYYSAPPAARKLRALAFAFPERPFTLDGYMHANFFPNSTVATAYGNFFVLTRTEPVAVGKTRLHWYMLSTRCGGRSQGAIDAARLIDESNRQFLRTTFQEDGAICAGTHEGCLEAEAHGYLGAQERRVAAFEQELERCMNTWSHGEGESA